jgi:hypothetical protein
MIYLFDRLYNMPHGNLAVELGASGVIEATTLRWQAEAAEPQLHST